MRGGEVRKHTLSQKGISNEQLGKCGNVDRAIGAG